MRLNFSFSELLHSDTAMANKINNIPTDTKTFDNVLTLITECLQPIRNYINKPMVITSGYRCTKLNTLVNGKPNSQHLTGQAVDFVIAGLTPKQIIEKIKASGVEFDQCIEEHSGNYNWVHISYNKKKNRKQTFEITQ